MSVVHGCKGAPDSHGLTVALPLPAGWWGLQDEPTARAVGSKSYNELVVQLVTALGSAAATPKQLTPTASFRAQQLGGEGFTPRAGSGGAGGLPAISETAPAGAAGGSGGGAQRIDAEALSAALRDSMHLTAHPQQQQLQHQQQEPPQQDGAAGAEGLRDSCRAVSNTSMQVGRARWLCVRCHPAGTPACLPQQCSG